MFTKKLLIRSVWLAIVFFNFLLFKSAAINPVSADSDNSDAPSANPASQVIIDDKESDGRLVDAINTKYFKARVGTTWEYSGYHNFEVIYGETKKDIINKVLKVLAIEKNNDGWKLLVHNSESGENEEWIINGQEFFIESDIYLKFPLNYGKRWLNKGEDDGGEWAENIKNRKDGYYQYEVEKKLDNKVLNNDCYVVGYKTLPDRSYSVFCDNIGIVENFYHHNGTPDDLREKLVKYRY